MTEVRLQNVRKSYDGISDTIPELNLVCQSGEMLALLGPSGCGKSTTLKMIAGIEGISSGQLFFDGRDVSDLDTASRNIAMVFEDYALYPHLSIFENIAFPLRIRRIPETEIQSKVEHLLKLLGLSDIAHESVQTLSGGAQQRVSIGRALVRNPSLIMFDEPLSHLDADQKVQLRTEIKRLQQTSKLTSVLVTHDQNEAIAMADRIAVMNEGTLQQVAAPNDIYNQPANLFVATFIGEPPMNLINAQLHRQSDSFSLKLTTNLSLIAAKSISTQLQPLADNEPLVIGVRPEKVQLNPTEANLSFNGKVFAIEPSGDTDVLTVDTELGRLTLEAPGPMFLCEGDILDLGFDAEDLHYFSKTTGRNLLAEQSCI